MQLSQELSCDQDDGLRTLAKHLMHLETSNEADRLEQDMP